MAKRLKQSLAEMLFEQGRITQEQLEAVQAEKNKTGLPLRKALIKLGIISEEDLVDFTSKALEVPRIELKNFVIDPKLIDLVPESLARKYQLIPILKIVNTLTCAMVDLFDITALDEIVLKTGLSIEPVLATEAEIGKALDKYYCGKEDLSAAINDLESKKEDVRPLSDLESSRLKEMGEEAPVVKLVNTIIAQAVKEGSSDIHIEPEEDALKIRFRIDGILHEKKSAPKQSHPALISRLKILGGLNIAEHRKPQDGRFQMKIENREIDIRVACVPTIYGENIVLRLLDATNILLGLKEIGLGEQTLERYQEVLNKTNGIILVTGPTGSGKTTTLYASLNSIKSPQKGIVTIEDPVEYHLPGIRQIQVDPQVNLTFAQGLRAILRQDPNVIMVGEIRDLETAEVSIQAALTGHLVLATLHTNNAAGAVTRLLDLGVEPFLLSSSINAVIAQRLIRIFCLGCKGKGCEACLNTGYKGRTAIYEVMVMNEKIRALTMKRSSMDEIQREAVSGGMRTLRYDGLAKVGEGITSQQEVFRVTQEDN